MAGCSAVDSAREALRYLAVVVKDVSRLDDAALGTYDFDLVIMVAQVRTWNLARNDAFQSDHHVLLVGLYLCMCFQTKGRD